MQRSRLGRSCKLYAIKSMQGPSFNNVYTQTGEIITRNVYHIHMSLMRLTLEYGAVCWDAYREGQ
jgi:hypothetical protein